MNEKYEMIEDVLKTILMNLKKRLRKCIKAQAITTRTMPQ